MIEGDSASIAEYTASRGNGLLRLWSGFMSTVGCRGHLVSLPVVMLGPWPDGGRTHE